eukprot:g35388.t1
MGEVDELVLSLYRVGAFKLGKFKLKSGVISPVYIDLRVIVSHPDILKQISHQLWLKARDLKFHRLCGVPYTALPMASVLSVEHSLPMLMRRKERKKYGTAKLIEGELKQGDTCLIIEDLVTSGLSIFETVEPLAELGVKVTDVVAVLDREQGGSKNLADGGIRLHSVLKISEMLQILLKHKKIEAALADQVMDFVSKNQITKTAPEQDKKASKSTVTTELLRMTFEERSRLSKTSMGRRLFQLMQAKQTNLCVSADVTKSSDLLRLADECGPYICVLKTHIDVLEDFSTEVWEKLQQLAKKHNFLLFEDRKYADIGNTVQMQFQQGVYKTSTYADIVNAHVVPGPGIIDGLKAGRVPGKDVALLLLAEMSSKGNLATGSYTEAAVRMAEENADFVMGFIAQKSLSKNPGLITMTPGVKLAKPGAGDKLGQQYNTPELVVSGGTDIIIVGRGIIAAKDGPGQASQRYREAGWRAYLKRTRPSRFNIFRNTEMFTSSRCGEIPVIFLFQKQAAHDRVDPGISITDHKWSWIQMRARRRSQCRFL